MKSLCHVLGIVALAVFGGVAGVAADQTVPGAGNPNAVTLAKQSPMVRSAYQFVLSQAGKIRDSNLGEETLDALGNFQTCVTHRAQLTDAQKNTIVQQLITEGLLNPADAAGIQGGAKAGVFPPVLN
jgi:hypothetical protein